jgi:cytochrome b561
MSPSSARAPLRYSGAMMAIHWATAILMATVVVLAWILPGGRAADGSALLMLHRSVGLVLLALTAVRLSLRSAQPAPAESDAVSRLENLAARLTHVLLYFILIAMPISGFLWTTSRGTDVSVFGLFAIPPLWPASETLRAIAKTLHSGGQFAVYVVVGLHAAAALFHLIVRRDDVMARMLPGAMAPTPPLPPAAAHPAAR